MNAFDTIDAHASKTTQTPAVETIVPEIIVPQDFRGNTDAPLTDAELPYIIPQHINREAAMACSKKYNVFESDSIVQELQRSGLVVRQAIVQKSRGWRGRKLDANGNVRPSALPTQTRHLYRMCRQEDFGKAELPEFVVVNSHDGSCSLTVYEGFFRLICSNGMIVGGKETMKIRHVGHFMDEVFQRIRAEAENFNRIYDKVDAFKARSLTGDEIREFAIRANDIRVLEHLRPVANPMDIVSPRRSEDVGNALWNVFNIAQENLIKGGLAMSRDGQKDGSLHRNSRAINGIQQNIGVNRRLWALAEEYAVA